MGIDAGLYPRVDFAVAFATTAGSIFTIESASGFFGRLRAVLSDRPLTDRDDATTALVELCRSTQLAPARTLKARFQHAGVTKRGGKP
jgi:hypothetical protein